MCMMLFEGSRERASPSKIIPCRKFSPWTGGKSVGNYYLLVPSKSAKSRELIALLLGTIRQSKTSK